MTIDELIRSLDEARPGGLILLSRDQFEQAFGAANLEAKQIAIEFAESAQAGIRFMNHPEAFVLFTKRQVIDRSQLRSRGGLGPNPE